jgi:hypothetical protein
MGITSGGFSRSRLMAAVLYLPQAKQQRSKVDDYFCQIDCDRFSHIAYPLMNRSQQRITQVACSFVLNNSTEILFCTNKITVRIFTRLYFALHISMGKKWQKT